MRPDGSRRESTTQRDSMKHRSLTEDEGKKGGRAHRRSRIPRFRACQTSLPNMVNGAGRPRAAPRGSARPTPATARGCGRCRIRDRTAPRDGAVRATGYLISTFAPCFFEGGLDLLGLVLRDAFLDGLRRRVDEVLGLLEAEPGQLADDLDDRDLVRPISVRWRVNSVCSSAAAAACRAAATTGGRARRRRRPGQRRSRRSAPRSA